MELLDENSRLARLQDALTSIRWEWTFHSAEGLPATLLELLKERLPHVAPESWPDRFEFGGIYVNGRAAPGDVPLVAPCRVEYFEPRFPIHRAREHFPAFSTDWIVYEDSHLVVVQKPNGLPCLPNREQKQFHLRGYLEGRFGRNVHLPSRIDTSTSGLVIASIARAMHRPLQHVFEHRRIEKYYLLETTGGFPEDEVDLHCRIGPSESHPILRAVVDSGGKPARTRFQRVCDRPGNSSGAGAASLVLARPTTGRTHQLRVQTQHLGVPIAGDNFYSGRAAQTLRLLSFRLRLLHPITGELLDVAVPPDRVPDWITGDDYARASALSDPANG